MSPTPANIHRPQPGLSMVDEFEQFRKRSYHGGCDVGLPASETCPNLGHPSDGTASSRVGPPLKRSRSHPVSTTCRPRRCIVRPAAVAPHPAVIVTCDTAPCPATLTPAGPPPEQPASRLSPPVSINSALHASINSLVLLPRISECMASQYGRRQVPHHVRVIPAQTRGRSRECRHMEFSTSDPAPRTAPPAFHSSPKGRPCSCRDAAEVGAFSVRILGQQGVGKATLVRIFTAADEPYTTNTENEDYSEGASVSVLRHGREDLLLLSCDVTAQVSEEGDDDVNDAFVVVYAVNDKHSFEGATKTVAAIRAHARDVPIVLVANKGDMVRSRVVRAKAGRDLAAKYRCKYVEASALLNINVDELFLGVLTQMHFCRECPCAKVAADSAVVNTKHRDRPIYRAMGYIGKLFTKNRECGRDIQNLFTP